MIKIHTMIKLWSKFIQSSKHDQNSYKCQIRSITIFKDQNFKKLIGIEFYGFINLSTCIRNRENQWKPWYFVTTIQEKIDPEVSRKQRKNCSAVSREERREGK